MLSIIPDKSKKKLLQERLAYIGEHFNSFQKNGSGYKACCPIHDDSDPSLSINEGNDGRILVKCMAGCPTEFVLDVVGLSFRDLMPNAKRIVAAYDYRDEEGELLYQSVRYEPKDFRVRRPKEGGGWDWSTKGVRRVLYRLHDLITADPKRLVFIVEGEKDVARLMDLELVATCNVGGAEKWREEYNEYLDGRHVAILPDNDTAGWEHARKVSLSLSGTAKSVKIVELPGLSDGGDVSDWLDAGGNLGNLRSLIKRTPTHRPARCKNPMGNPMGNAKGSTHRVAKSSRIRGAKPDGLPDGLAGRIGSKPDGYDPQGAGSMGRVEVPLFPVDVFPGVLRDYAESIADALPCPVDFPATMMLSVLSTFIGRKRRIAIKKSWEEYPVLWIAVVARSGDRKSPAFEKVTEPLRHRQKIFLAEYHKAKVEYEALPDKEKATTPKPRLKQILTTDTTIEALKDILAVNPNGISFCADELAGWARSLGQYKGGRGDDRQIWLSIWSSELIATNRKSSPEPIVVPDPFVSIVGGIQPDALPDLIDDTREDGFSARILFAWPDEIPHGDWTEETIQGSLFYASICEQLFDLPHSDEPIKVSLSAYELWIEWVNAHRAESPLDNLRPTWSKAEGHCLRLTLVLHLARKFCNETRSKDIDEKSMAGGIAIIDYFKSHALRVYGNLPNVIGKDRIPKAIKWIRKHGGTMTARKAKLNGFTKTVTDAKELFDDLQELGCGIVSEGKQGSVTFTLTGGDF